MAVESLSDPLKLCDLKSLHDGRTQFDKAVLESLEHGNLELELKPYTSLDGKELILERFSICRKDQPVTSVFHLPLNSNTIYHLDIFALNSISNVSKLDVCNAITIHASTLQHPDFTRDFESILLKNPELLKNTYVFIRFRYPFDNGSVDFDVNIQHIKMVSMGLLIDGFGHNYAGIALIDQYSFDGVEIHNLFNEMAGLEKRKNLLIKCVAQQLKADGKLILSGYTATREEFEFLEYLGVDAYLGSLDSLIV